MLLAMIGVPFDPTPPGGMSKPTTAKPTKTKAHSTNLSLDERKLSSRNCEIRNHKRNLRIVKSGKEKKKMVTKLTFFSSVVNDVR